MSVSWSVLVVCEGNLARSPLAAALLAREWPVPPGGAVTFASAGTHARHGHPAAPAMRKVARSLAVDLEDHRSRPLTPELLRESDLVLTMTESQRENVQRLLPSATARTFSIIEFVRLLHGHPPTDAALPTIVRAAHMARPRSIPPAEVEDVEDPFGRSDRVFVRVGATLSRLVKELADALPRENTVPRQRTQPADAWLGLARPASPRDSS